MKMELECMPCFLRQVLMELNGSEMNGSQKERAMRNSLKVLSDIDYNLPPVGVSLILHRKLIDDGVDIDPYAELKKRSTRKALEIVPRLEKMIDNSVDRLVMASKIAIAGNVVDYGAANQLDLMTILNNSVEKGIKVDDSKRFGEDLLNASTVSYYLDNSGEVVTDAILIKEILRINPDIRITAYAKKTPLLNDVTPEDCLDAGLDKIDGLTVVPLDEGGWATPETISMNGGDVIISKGQGNYESLSDVKGIYFLLVVKCNIISKDLGADIGEMVLKRS